MRVATSSVLEHAAQLPCEPRRVDPSCRAPVDVVIVEKLSATANAEVLLRGIDLRVQTGVPLALVGAAGSGKSLLLQLLCSAGAVSGVAVEGTLTVPERRVLVPQRARARAADPSDPATAAHLHVVAEALRSDAMLVCLDEPTAGIDGVSRARVLQMLRRAARDRAIVYVTHNRRDAFALGGDIALIVGGRVVERASVASFFTSPTTELGRGYVRTGSCPTALVPDEPVAASSGRPLAWVLPHQLVGCSRPGLLGELRDDLARLRDAGIGLLVCLEEQDPTPTAEREAMGIAGHHIPIVDMQAPTLDEALDVCARIDRTLESGAGVAVHCRGGLGRTGTILACYVAWHRGVPATQALRSIREVEAGFVQSQAQHDFLAQFCEHIQSTLGRHSAPASTTTPV